MDDEKGRNRGNMIDLSPINSQYRDETEFSDEFGCHRKFNDIEVVHEAVERDKRFSRLNRISS